MNSKKLVTPVLAVLAVSGWGWGFYQKSGNKDSDVTGPVAGSRSPDRRDRRAPSIASLLPTARSARLFNSLDEIAGEPSGEVNKKLLAAMRTTLADNDPTRRGRDFALLLDLMRPEDALAVHELFLEYHRDGQTFGEYAPFAKRWGQVDGAGAMDALMNEKPLRLYPHDIRNIVIGWSSSDPLSAIAWMKEHPEFPGSATNFDAVIQGWINLDRDSATRYLLGVEVSLDDRIRGMRNAADEILSGSGVEATVDWLTSLPPTDETLFAATEAWGAISWRLGEMPYDKAAKAWTDLSANSIGRIDQLNALAEASAKSRVATNGSRGFIDALADQWPVDEAVRRFSEWNERNPDQVQNFINRYGDSPYVQRIADELEADGMDLPVEEDSRLIPDHDAPPAR